MQLRSYQNIVKITVKCSIFSILRYSDLFLGVRYSVSRQVPKANHALALARSVARARIGLSCHMRSCWQLLDGCGRGAGFSVPASLGLED